MNSIRDEDLGTRGQRTLNPGRSSPPLEKLSLTEQLARAETERERAVAAAAEEYESYRLTV